MEPAEARKLLCGYKYDPKPEDDASIFVKANGPLPDQIDWRENGVVSSVKNQGSCGACWAFSATGALESQTSLKSKRLVFLSEQNLIDCSWEEGNRGCKGGSMDNAFIYIKRNGGIDTEESYPYEAAEGTCRYSAVNIGATCGELRHTSSGDEEALKEAVANVGPISVGIDTTDNFQFYKGGVLNDNICLNSPGSLDHGVLVVGYGSESGVDYWLVKNSWGTSFGENGYIKMARNQNNQCGIATAPCYPLV